LFNVNDPDPIEPAHEFVPAYVPVRDDDEAWPSPDTVALHEANGLSNPPAGTVIEKRIAPADRVPVIDPRPLMPVAVSVIVTLPEIDVSACESCHVITPAPVESVAVPAQVPTMFTDVPVGVGVVGVFAPLLPHAPVNASASTAIVNRPVYRR